LQSPSSLLTPFPFFLVYKSTLLLVSLFVYSSEYLFRTTVLFLKTMVAKLPNSCWKYFRRTVSNELTLWKIAIWMSKDCQKLAIFLKKIDKNCFVFFQNLPLSIYENFFLAIFFLNCKFLSIFWHSKCNFPESQVTKWKMHWTRDFEIGKNWTKFQTLSDQSNT